MQTASSTGGQEAFEVEGAGVEHEAGAPGVGLTGTPGIRHREGDSDRVTGVRRSKG